MSLTLTARQERFARFLFQGLPQREAFIKAGYSSNSSVAVQDVRACELAKSSKLKVRLAELQAAAKDDTVATVLERKRILTDHARAQLVDFVSADGEVQLSREIPHHRAASEFSTLTIYDQEGNPKVKKTLKLRDPVAAIQELNRMEMIGTPRESVNKNINVVFVIGKGYSNATALKQGIAGTIDVEHSDSDSNNE